MSPDLIAMYTFRIQIESAPGSLLFYRTAIDVSTDIEKAHRIYTTLIGNISFYWIYPLNNIIIICGNGQKKGYTRKEAIGSLAKHQSRFDLRVQLGIQPLSLHGEVNPDAF